jgi:hypothetical protein
LPYSHSIKRFLEHRKYARKSNWGSKPKFCDYECGVLSLLFSQILPISNFYSIHNTVIKITFSFAKDTTRK